MRKFVFALCVSIGLMGFSQDKMLTIKDAITGYHLYPKGLYSLQWLPDGDWYSRLVIGEDGQRSIDVQQVMESSARNINITLDDLKGSTEDSIALNRLPHPKWMNNKEFLFTNGNVLYAYHIENKKSRVLSTTLVEGVSHQLFDDGSGYVAETTDGLVYEYNGKVYKASSQEPGIVIGKTVHRSEFGITHGLYPSPSHSKLAYYEMDESMVTEYPLYKLADTPATANMLRYPTAGAESHHVSVKVVDMRDPSDVVTIKAAGDPELYHTNVSWTPDERYILIAIVNRAQNHMWLNKYDAKTGELVKTLFEEENDRYVEPEHPALFLKNDPDKFIWWSERDGYNHLYLYDIDGNLIKQLTKGDWVVTQYHGMSNDGKKVYITATKDSPIDRHLYCVNTKNGKMENLTQTEGYHSVIANADCSMFMDNYSNTKTPKETRLIDGDGNLEGILHTATNPLKDYKLGEMELGVLKNEEGTDLHYRVFKPIDFDPAKKYPAVVYLYNGPHLQLVTNRWLGGANLWYQYMAQQGYVVFSIDGRGSADRGFDFESSIHRNCGENEMKDQLIGVEWLKKQSWVDADRLGIHGWSYGGFMTTSMMSRHPGVFKVGVAGGPVIDWSLYEIMYTERYMDTPEENPEGYAKTNLKNHLDSLEGDLLMIHGGLDDVVLWQHSLQYLEQAVSKGIQLDYFVYPKHKHNVRGRDRVHLYEKVSKYFFDHL